MSKYADFVLKVCLIGSLMGFGVAHAQTYYVVGISQVVKTSNNITLYGATSESYDTYTDYLSDVLDMRVYQGSSLVWDSGSLSGLTGTPSPCYSVFTQLSGGSTCWEGYYSVTNPPQATFTVLSSHGLILNSYTDPDCDPDEDDCTLYSNPEGFTDILSGNVYQGSEEFLPSNGDPYLDDQTIYLGNTEAYVGGDPPVITQITPTGLRGQIGQPVVIEGTNLSGAQLTINFGVAGTITDYHATTTLISFYLSIPANATPGPNQFLITTPSGSATSPTFTIGDRPPFLSPAYSSGALPEIPLGEPSPIKIQASYIQASSILTVTPDTTWSQAPTSGTFPSISQLSGTATPTSIPGNREIYASWSGPSGVTYYPLPGVDPSGRSNVLSLSVVSPNVTIVSGSGADGVCTTPVPIPNNTLSVVVGQPVKFTACVPIQPAYTETWSPDTLAASIALSGYAVTVDTTGLQFTQTLTPMTSTVCGTGPFCTFNQFYILVAGTYSFTFQYFDGASFAHSSTVTVVATGPTPDSNGNYFTAQRGKVQLYPVATWNKGAFSQNPHLSAVAASGDPSQLATVGLNLTPIAIAPTATGTWIFVQTIATTDSVVASPLISPVMNVGLDGGYAVTTNSFNDSPGRALGNILNGASSVTDYGEYATSFTATVFMLWDPTIPDPATHLAHCSVTTSSLDPETGLYDLLPSDCISIPVPVASFTWGYASDSLETLSPSQPGIVNGWSELCAAAIPVGSQNQGPAVYPTWTNTVNPNHPNQ